MIDRLELRNYRTHASSRVPLSRLTVVVGPNGSGKTSILEALDCMCRIPRERTSDVFDGRTHPGEIVRSGETGFSLGLASDRILQWSASLDFLWQATSPSRGRWGASVQFEVDGSAKHSASVEDFAQLEVVSVPAEIAGELGPVAFLRLDGAELAESTPPTPGARIARDGRGLPSVLARLALESPDRLRAIENDLRRVVPAFRGLRVRQVHPQRKLDQVHFAVYFDFEGATNVPARSISEGTLIALGLVTLLNDVDGRPRLILLDDLEHSLHPRAQWELIDMLRRAQEGDPQLQIVASSHSPYLVDRLEPSEVVVTALDAQGITRCASLASHPKAEQMRGVLSTGEFLSAEGEEWVLGESA